MWTNKKLLFPAAILFTCLFLVGTGGWAQEAARYEPAEEFYNRKGLEEMPRLNYQGLPVVNVKELGALGDGVQDAQPFFERAVAQLREQGGGVLFIPEGTYNFQQKKQNTVWAVGKQGDAWPELKNIHFVGEGERTIIRFEVDASNFGTGWAFGTCENISLSKMSFTIFPYFDSRQPVGMGIYTLRFGSYQTAERRARNITLVNLTFDQGILGPWIQDTEKIWVVDCTVRNTSADGIHLDNVRDGVVAYCSVEHAGDDGMASIASLNSLKQVLSQNTSFLYNKIYESKFARGITLGGINCQAIGNWIEAVNCAGVSFNGFGHSGEGFPLERIKVMNNTIIRADLNERGSYENPSSHPWHTAVSLESETRTADIVGNRIYGSQYHGIWLKNPGSSYSDISIVGNDIQGNWRAGISLAPQSAVDRLNVNDNFLLNNAGGNIALDGKTQNSIIQGNVEQANDKAPWQDIYDGIRREPQQTSWQAPPKLKEQGETVNVRDWGAKGDGTTNDAPAFNRALAQLPEAGGVLHIPAGEYLLAPPAGSDTAPFTIIKHHLLVADRRNIVIRGEKGKTTLLFSDADHQGIRLLNAENCAVIDLNLRLIKQPELRHNRALLDISGCRGIILSGITSLDSGGPGIQIEASTGVLMENCTVRNAGTHGLRLLSSRQVTVAESLFADSRDNGIFVSYYGSVSRLPQFVRLVKNKIIGTREGYGIAVASGDDIELLENEITGTYLAGIGIYQHTGFFAPKRVSVRGNSLVKCNIGALTYTAGAISVFKLSRGSLEISGNEIVSTSGSGLWIADSKGLERLSMTKNRYRDLGEGKVSITVAQVRQIKDFVSDDVDFGPQYSQPGDKTLRITDQMLVQQEQPRTFSFGERRRNQRLGEKETRRYVYRLSFDQMDVKKSNKFFQDVSWWNNIDLGCVPGDANYIYPVSSKEAEFGYIFDFSGASYRPVAVTVRDRFFSIQDGVSCQSFVSEDGVNWQPVTGLAYRAGMSSIKGNTVRLLLNEGGKLPDRVYYKAVFKISDGTFKGIGNQWNRIHVSEADKNDSLCFQCDFELEPVK